MNGHQDLCLQLANIGIEEAMIVGNNDKILEMLNYGADPNLTMPTTGWTPLMFFVTKNDMNGVNILLESGSDVNIEEQDGWTPIMFAANMGLIDMVDVLVRSGADIYHQTFDGRTPLYLAQQQKHVDVVKFLQSELNENNNNRATKRRYIRSEE